MLKRTKKNKPIRLGRKKKIYLKQKSKNLSKVGMRLSGKFINNLYKVKLLIVLTLLVLTSGLFSFEVINAEINKFYTESIFNIKSLNDNEVHVKGISVEAIPTDIILESQVKLLDKRTYVLDEYFRVNNSPLYGQGENFVSACNKYNAPKDCILTTAIAKHETDLCKYANSAEMFNCMGWGGGGVHRRSFSSFKEHIDIATDVLVNQYGIRYMDDPRLMEDVFCGPQDECNGWGNRVLIIMREIDEFAESLGVGRLTDLRSDGERF